MDSLCHSLKTDARIKTDQEARRLQSAAHYWLTGFCIKNKVTAPIKGASVRRGSSITRNVPYNCKQNRPRKTESEGSLKKQFQNCDLLSD